jgi:hypothetical protein
MRYLIFGLMVLALGCGKSKEERIRDEAKQQLGESLGVKDVDAYADKLNNDMEQEQAAEKALWADWKSAFPVVETHIRDGFPYARDCRFDRSGFKVKEQLNRHIDITGEWIGKDENDKPARVAWKATAFIFGGKWQVEGISVTGKKPL